MDVGGWLRKLGLEEYEAAFRDNRIDGAVLPNLTAEDLKDLGVGFVGDRRKLLDAIAALRAKGCGPTPLSDAPLGTGNQEAAERRQITVMFSDLVGSTALSARMDPEDLREIISAYQRCVTEIVRRFSGFVAKYMGDGVLIYFGYPLAHEDDAERAVRAGLEAIAAVGALKHSVPLQTRIGIATGLVVVGDLIGSGEAQERGIVGETPNLAARLQALAEPNAVVLAESTRKLLGNLFELRDLGPQELKGVPGLMRAFVALRASTVASRFEAMHPGDLSALLGREEELELLLRRWARAKCGEGQVVLVSGEAGIGKSRLSAALMEGIAAEPHTRLRYFCSPQHTDSALHPIIGQLERAARFAVGDTPEARLNKLDGLLAQGQTSPQDAALLAEMLSLPNDGRYPALALAPAQRRQKTLEALALQLETLARSTPVLMILEDAHWADPTSLEVFGRAADRIEKLPVLLIVTFRPDFEAPWIGQPHVTALALNRLGRRDVDSLIDRVVGNKPLPADIRKDIIERSDGVPLFVEEMTKAVLEAGGELAAMQIAAAVPTPALAVPASLHAAKEVAQIGAAIGREFSHALLASVVGKPGAELTSALDRLVQAGLLFRQGLPPHATYLFKHALVQDAAYGTLLRTSRQQLHGRIVNALDKEFPETIEVQPELLARHCAEAGLNEKAIKYWRAAGEKAVRRAANREAIEHFRQALAINESQLTELAILSQLGPALMSVHGWSAPEVGLVFDRAEHLARALESSIDLAPPLAGSWLFHTARGQFWRAEEITKELFHIAHSLQDPDIQLQAHHCAWPISWFRGALSEANAHADAGLTLYDEARHAKHRYLYLGHDPAICALSIKSILQWLLGHPVQGEHSERNAIELAGRLKHAPSLAHALWFVCQAQVTRGDATAVIETASELLALSEENGLPQTRATASAYLGWAIAQTGDFSRGIRLLEGGFATYRQLGVRSNQCLIICLLAETYLTAGQYRKGLEYTDLAIAVSSEIGDRWCLPRIHMIRGQLLQKLQENAAAEADLRMAIDIAAAQSAKGAQLQAATSLARLRRDQGKRVEARELLAPIYGWFTEGFDTLDLKQARALLDELAP